MASHDGRLRDSRDAHRQVLAPAVAYLALPTAACPVPQPTDDEVRRRYGLAPDARIYRTSGPADKPLRLTPDSFTLHQVDSSLEWAVWDRPVAVAGTTAHLSVQGAFVGEGSPLDVTLKDGRNQTAGRGTGPMHRGRAVVSVEVDRQTAAREPDGVLCAADVRLTELGLKAVSAPLLVLPFAELVDARWSTDRTAEGETVGLSCRVEGTAAGVERLSREPAEVAVFARTASGAAPLDEPIVALRTQAEGGRVEVEWMATLALDRWDLPSQAELDAEAARRGLPVGQPPYVYDRPHLVFRVRLARLEAESGPLAVDDWTELKLAVSGEPASGRPYTLTLADGTVREGTLDGDGTALEDGLPPGPVSVTYDADDRPPADDDGVPPPAR